MSIRLFASAPPEQRRRGASLMRRVGAVLAVGLLAVAGCSDSSDSAGPSRVKIGFLASLTGPYQAVGADMRTGFEIYLKTHGNALGGHPVDLVVADEGDGPNTALPAATRMVKQDRVAAIAGVVSGGTAAAVAKLATSSAVPFVGANGRPKLDDVRWVWHTSFLSEEPGIAIASHVKQKVGSGTVYAIGPDYQGGIDELKGFTDAFTAAGGKLANADGKTTFTPYPSTPDFLPYFAKIKDSGAAAVYTFYAGAEAVKFVQAYRQSDIKDVPLYAAGFLTEGETVLPKQGDAAVGIITVLNYAPDLKNPANDAFVAAWRADGRASLPTTYAMAAYDAAAVLDRAIAGVGGEVTPGAINTAIGKLGQIDSPRGAWNFSAAHHPVQKWYLREVVKDPQVLTNRQIQDLATLGNS